MATPVIMPRQGQSVETCIITQWYKKEGEKVREGDVLFSYETDKASFDFESPEDGILLKILFDEGDEVPVLKEVAYLGEKGEEISESSEKEKTVEEKDEEIKRSRDQETHADRDAKMQETKGPQESQRRRISPRASKMADVHGIDFGNIEGSGPNGRIIARDIESHIKEKPEIREISLEPGTYEDIKLTNIRKIIAGKMHASLQNSAQLTHHTGADARKIMTFRKKVKELRDQGKAPDITLNDMVAYSLVKALKKHPQANTHFLGDRIRQFSDINLGVAVHTERGLMVPVVQNAGILNISGLSERIKNLADQCRSGKIDPDLIDPEAGSFTLTNLGAYGVEMFTPILNLPQTGILGVNTITYRPADMGDGVIGMVPFIGLSLTYDHRAIDGAPASAFLQDIKKEIESFSADI